MTLWEELSLMHEIHICQNCHEEISLCVCGSCKCATAAALTESELDDLVKRVMGEAVKDALRDYRCAGCGETNLTIEDLFFGYHGRTEVERDKDGDPYPVQVQCGPISKPDKEAR